MATQPGNPGVKQQRHFSFTTTPLYSLQESSPVPPCMLWQEDKCHAGSQGTERAGQPVLQPGDLPLPRGRRSRAPSLVSGEANEEGQLQAHTSPAAQLRKGGVRGQPHRRGHGTTRLR